MTFRILPTLLSGHVTRATWSFMVLLGGLFAIAPVAVSTAAAEDSTIRPRITRLTTNGRANPLGIPAQNLSFGWASTSTERGVKQRAYQIRVGTRPEGDDVWNSGRVASARQVHIALPDSIVPAPATRYHWQVRIWDQAGRVSDWSENAWFETGLAGAAGWSGAMWVRPSPPATSSVAGPSSGKSAPAEVQTSLPLLRGEFTARAGVASVRLYASAQGLYEASVNGRRVGDHYLAPGWTDYNKRIQHQTYDITTLVRPGINVVGAALADGWFRGKVGLNWTAVYGTDPAFIAKVKIDYEDGSVDWFGTDGDWRAAAGPFVRGDLQDGETYDAARAQPGWNAPGFDASAWRRVALADDVSDRLVPQPDEPVRVLELLPARSRAEVQPGTWVYDLGQNMVGVVRVVLRGAPGQTITLRHAEDIYRTGPRAGQIYTENLRTAAATDRYTFAAEEVVTYQPTFTQHGFRYVEITGVQSPPEIGEVQGVVLGSDLPGGGDLHTGHRMLDQLVSNIRWGQRGNFLSIPTDTPARDERLGWTGDINVFAPAAARYQDTRAFLAKWMTDVRDAQKVDGNIPAVVPQPRDAFDETGVGWSDAFITVPYSVWRATGDESILRENWEAMKRFYEYVHASATGDGDLLEQGRASWFSGDWLTLEQVDRLEEHKVIGTVYFAENTRMMAEVAAALGEVEQAAEWSALLPRIRAAFVDAYRAEDGTIYTGTQTAYAHALGADMIADPDKRTQTAARFLEKLAADDTHLRTGFLGTPWLLPALTKIGREDLAMRVLLNEDYPSWGFPIRMSATTMWERWNSIQPDGEFGPVDMNSFNHYAYGAVGDWMFGHLGGLHALEPGYRRTLIAPLMGSGGLTRVRCEQETPYGRLAAAWRVADGEASLEVQIPVNTSAIVRLPGSDGVNVNEDDRAAADAPGVRFLRVEDGAALYSVGSGTYAFTWRFVPPGP